MEQKGLKNLEIINLFMKKKIKYFTQKYAHPHNQKYFDCDWDFTFPQ